MPTDGVVLAITAKGWALALNLKLGLVVGASLAVGTSLPPAELCAWLERSKSSEVQIYTNTSLEH